MKCDATYTKKIVDTDISSTGITLAAYASVNYQKCQRTESMVHYLMVYFCKNYVQNVSECDCLWVGGGVNFCCCKCDIM